MNFTRNQTQTIIRSSYNCSNPSADLNYPSFVTVFFRADQGRTLTRRFQRTVTNVGDGAATYKVKLEVPVNTTMRIRPETLVFRKKYEKLSYSLTIRYRADVATQHRPGSVTWIEQNGKHTKVPYFDDLGECRPLWLNGAPRRQLLCMVASDKS
ncbi:hypothetical protein DH2020_008216 [Rehmannia glutinosa]|uniref:Subtilisin-like protease fibronectin type-III domain-containing protein n=1 Tax=Rehmannia glutinosa TaxID=99300 RepID=A0ABR0U131_REHGL